VRKAILNVAGMGKFSSDRTIGEYARTIWNVEARPRQACNSLRWRRPEGSAEHGDLCVDSSSHYQSATICS
jgi:starch phosphorylase